MTLDQADEVQHSRRRLRFSTGCCRLRHSGESCLHRGGLKLTEQLINNAKLALLFTETLQKRFAQSPIPYVEGTKPSEVKSWKEFVPAAASQ